MDKVSLGNNKLNMNIHYLIIYPYDLQLFRKNQNQS